MQSIEEMMAVLEREGCEPVRTAAPATQFARLIEFTACGVRYWLEWYANIAYLSIGARHGNYIMFTKLAANDTWPSFRRGLEFSSTVGEPVYVATKLLDWQEPPHE